MDERNASAERSGEIRRLCRTFFLNTVQAEDVLDTLEALRERIDAPAESFSQMLDRLIRASGRKPSEVYTEADMDRRVFSRIRKYPAYPVKKKQIVRLALVLRLRPEELHALLKTAGLTLSDSDPADILIRGLFERGIFDQAEISILLRELGLKEDAL